eukprot:6307841-Prymnesium_polylepis.2
MPKRMLASAHSTPTAYTAVHCTTIASTTWSDKGPVHVTETTYSPVVVTEEGGVCLCRQPTVGFEVHCDTCARKRVTTTTVRSVRVAEHYRQVPPHQGTTTAIQWYMLYKRVTTETVVETMRSSRCAGAHGTSTGNVDKVW